MMVWGMRQVGKARSYGHWGRGGGFAGFGAAAFAGATGYPFVAYPAVFRCQPAGARGAALVRPRLPTRGWRRGGPLRNVG